MVVQRDEAWPKKAKPEEIAAADAAGELDELQGRTVTTDPAFGTIPGLQRDAAWVESAPPEHIAAAYDAGELDAYLRIIPWPASMSEPEKPARGLLGDGTIVTPAPAPRGDIPHVSGPAVTIPVGIDPKDARTPTPTLFTDPRKG
jgi:hypothetical protein